jgi:hypothetical protein
MPMTLPHNCGLVMTYSEIESNTSCDNALPESTCVGITTIIVDVGWLVGWLVGSLHIPLRILERDFGASDIIELTKEDAIHSSLLDGGAVDW